MRCRPIVWKEGFGARFERSWPVCLGREFFAIGRLFLWKRHVPSGAAVRAETLGGNLPAQGLQDAPVQRQDH